MSTPLVSTDPSAIANAASCFASCVPDQLFLRTYLLNNAVIAASPPCVTPTAPGGASNGAPIIIGSTGTTISIAWKQVRNTGSLITAYQVFWGTTSGGPYPNQSAILGAGIRNYTITGLSPSTTYYMVVQAISFTGCVSANSTQGTTSTTSGTNGLLNGLVHFYQFQEAAAMFADSGSDPIALNYTNAGAGFARTTGHVQAFAGSYNGVSGTVNDTGTIAAAPFDFTGDGTGNIPMTWACWIQMLGAAGAQPATATLASVWTPVWYFAWVNTNNLQLNMQNAGGATITCSSPFVYDNNWHLLVGGFDFANGVIFFSVDNGAKITQAVAQAKSVNSTSFNIGNCSACGGNCPNFAFSDVAVWLNRALNATDINNLWNVGAGLPFSQFTH
jgi:hypothetical protein